MLRLNLPAVRANARYNQKEWAKKLGVSTSTIVNWEKGASVPDSESLRKMSELSAIPMDYIFVERRST